MNSASPPFRAPGAAGGMNTMPTGDQRPQFGHSDSLENLHGREMDFATTMLNQQATPGHRPQGLGMLPLQVPLMQDPGRFDTSLLFANTRQDHPSPSPTLSSHRDSESTSRSHSVGIDRGPLFDFARGYSVPPTPQMSYHNNSPHLSESFAGLGASHSPPNILQLLLQEMQKMNGRMSGIETMNGNILTNQEQLAARVQGTEETLNSLQESVSTLSTQMTSTATVAKKSASTSKNISNQHPKLKAILHPIFFELMGINKAGDQSLVMNQLVALGHPPDDQAFITVTSAEGVEKIAWRPRWTETVNSKVNVVFIKEIVQCIMRNEKAKRERGTGALDDADYDEKVVSIMAKDYFRNIAEQYKTHINPEMTSKRLQKKVDGRHRNRRATAANQRRDPQAIKALETLFDVEGSAALIDTDWGSDYLTCSENTLSDDSRNRRKEQDVGKGARMSVGLSWRSVDYVAFLRVLDTIRRRQLANPGPSTASVSNPADTTSNSNPPTKHRKMHNKQPHKLTWDAHPSKMTDRYPDTDDDSAPFRFMVNPAWLDENPSKKVTELDGLKWLEGFYSQALQKGDLDAEDKTYLQELSTWSVAENSAPDRN